MANVITMSGPSPSQEIVSHYLDQFNANQRAQQEAELQRQQMAQTGQYQQGVLADAQRKFSLLQQEYDSKQMNEKFAPIKEHLSQMYDAADSAQDPNQKAAIEAQTKAFLDSLPADLQAKAKYEAVKPFMTAQRQAGLNAATNAANRQTLGTTDPYAVAESTKSVYGAFPTQQMFTQAQATDLSKRDQSPDATTPDLTKTIPKPSGDAVSDYEARATAAMPRSAENLTSQTEITTQGMRDKTQRDIAAIKDQGGNVDQQQVSNVVTAINAAVDKGIDPDPILNRIKPNKDLYNAVVDSLSNPQNIGALGTKIGPAQRTALAEIDPLIEQTKKVITRYGPYKDQNSLTDRDTISYGLYRAGQKPPDDSPVADAADLQMLGVQAGARLLKGGSRAYPALKMAMAHAGDAAIDTRANIYSKSLIVMQQLLRVHDSNAGTPGLHTVTPDGLIWKKNSDGSFTQDTSFDQVQQ